MKALNTDSDLNDIDVSNLDKIGGFANFSFLEKIIFLSMDGMFQMRFFF